VVFCALAPWATVQGFPRETHALRVGLDRPARPIPVRATYGEKTLAPLFGDSRDHGAVFVVPATPPGMERLRAQSAAELRAALRARGYRLAAIRAGRTAVPRLGLARMPRDIHRIDDVSLRKSLFLRSVLPLVLMVDEELRGLRRALQRTLTEAAGPRGLSPRRRAWLVDLAARYDVDHGDWTALLHRVDTVPVSLALAQAAQESGWGSSRFAREGNALFGQRTWRSEVPGLVPDRRAEDAEHRVRAFSDLLSAVRTYMHNLNTHPAYAAFRRERAAARARGAAPDPRRLAETLTRYAEHGEGYIAAVHAIMRVNRLRDFDAAHLAYPAGTKLADLY
jgi:Bax protein